MQEEAARKLGTTTKYGKKASEKAKLIRKQEQFFSSKNKKAVKKLFVEGNLVPKKMTGKEGTLVLDVKRTTNSIEVIKFGDRMMVKMDYYAHIPGLKDSVRITDEVNLMFRLEEEGLHLIGNNFFLKKGYTEEDIRKICGENLLRVWSEVRRIAQELQSE